MKRKDPRRLIVDALRKNPEGLTLLSLAEVTGLHRHTCTKYVHELIGAGIVHQRNVGVAKLCYLNSKIATPSDEEKALEALRKKRTRRVQLRLLVTVVVLSFLLSESVIIAYENSTLLNQTNISNTSPVTSSVNNSDLNIIPNITESSNNSSNISVDAPTNETLLVTDGSVGGTNETDFLDSNETLGNGTEPENSTEPLNQSIIPNVTLNETLEMNETDDITNETNGTLNENITKIIENITEELAKNETSIDSGIDVKLLYSGKITRGEATNIRADLINTGSLAGNVVLSWILPDGFSLVSGSLVESCGDLDSNASCYSEISVTTNLSMPLGMNEIRVVVDYEK
jgi:hypothetical protein